MRKSKGQNVLVFFLGKYLENPGNEGFGWSKLDFVENFNKIGGLWDGGTTEGMMGFHYQR